MRPSRSNIPPGTLDVRILRTLLGRSPLHGSEIAGSIERSSGEVFQVEEQSLYPVQQKVLLNGWTAGDGSKTPENGRARYYTLTKAVRKPSEREVDQYNVGMSAIARILKRA